MKKSLCPKCKSDNISFYSRQKYLLKLAACLATVGLCYLIISRLKNDSAGAAAGLIGSAIFFCLAVVFGAYYLVMSLVVGATHYKCGYCSNKFTTALRGRSVYDEISMSRSKRRREQGHLSEGEKTER